MRYDSLSRYKERPDAIYIYISVLTILIALISPYKSTKSVQVLVAAECHAARSSGVTSQQRDRRQETTAQWATPWHGTRTRAPLHSGQHRDTWTPAPATGETAASLPRSGDTSHHPEHRPASAGGSQVEQIHTKQVSWLELQTIHRFSQSRRLPLY